MDAFDEVQNVVQKLSWWQQEIFERIVNNQDISDKYLNSIIEKLLQQNAKANVFCNKPTQPKNVETGNDVRIIEIKDIINVNKISRNSHLNCDRRKNLVVIYGGNGTGKTGYGRILKNCCDASLYGDKSNATIIGNIYTGDDNKGSKATIVYSVRQKEEQYVWDSSNYTYNADLAKINVFDDIRSKESLLRGTEIVYKPYGISFLEKLISSVDHLKDLVNAKINECRFEDVSWLNDYSGITDATILNKLYRENNASEVRKKVDDFLKAQCNDDAIEDLKSELALLKNNTPERIKKTKDIENKNLCAAKRCVNDIICAIDNKALEKYNSAIKKFQESKENAERAKELSFNEEEYLSGTGNEFWKILWRAAKDYLNSMHIDLGDNREPSISELGRCVLCQQTIDSDTSIKMKRFEEYVNDRSQEDLKERNAVIVAIIDNLSDILDEEKIKQQLNPIETFDRELFNGIYSKLLEVSDSINKNLLENVKNSKAITEVFSNEKAILKKLLGQISDKIDSNTKYIEELGEKQSFDKKIEELEKNIKEKQFIQKAIDEKDNILSNIQTSIYRCKLVDISDKQCKTTDISRGISNINEKYVIDSLSNNFREMLEGATENKISCHIVKDKTSKGISSSKIVLNVKNGTNIASVLSDGEADIVSLIGFFSEQKTFNNNSTVVLEDPVSSVDHVYSEEIAKIVCSEALKRQIIVFTHDAIFLTHLQKYSEKMNIDPDYKTMRATNESTGVISDDIPLEKMSTGKRIKALNNKLQELKTLYGKEELDKYQQDGQEFYRLLRKAWERFVEEILFGGALQRFDSEIHTKKLGKIKADKSHYVKVCEQMTECSKYCHDNEQQSIKEVGNIESLEKALSELKSMYKNLKLD